MAREGGPAFPRAAFCSSDVTYEDCGIHDAQEGMSLRDWFAGQALVGILSFPGCNEQCTATEAAQWAFEMADAMITERAKTPWQGGASPALRCAGRVKAHGAFSFLEVHMPATVKTSVRTRDITAAAVRVFRAKFPGNKGEYGSFNLKAFYRELGHELAKHIDWQATRERLANGS